MNRHFAFKALVTAICTYEVAAVVTGRSPTVTTLCGRYRWLAPVIIAGLAVHLYWKPA